MIPTDLGGLGGINSEAEAINTSGQIVGWSQITGSAVQHATFWNGDTATDLNSFLDAATVNAGWVLIGANDINDNGAIVGFAANHLLGTGVHAFLLSPIPELEIYAMLLSGLGLLAYMRRRQTDSGA